jgi:hypothetical protein
VNLLGPGAPGQHGALLAAAAASGWSYELLVLLHIICAVGGPGALAYRAFVLDLARRQGGAAAAGALGAFAQVSQVGEILLYGTPVFGAAAIVASGHCSQFERPWAYLALALFVLMVGLLHGLVRPAERGYRTALAELAATAPMKPPARPPQLEQLEGFQRRVGLGIGLFNLCLLGSLYLMVFKP